jgi:hypothetical protein
MSGTRSSGRRPPRRRSGRGWSSRTVLLCAAIVAGIGAAVIIAIAAAGGDDATEPVAPAASGGVTGGDFHSLVVDPTNPGRLLVGGHQAVSESIDGGRTWTRIETLDGADAMGWAFTVEGVWVSGHPGITRSTDGAATFQRHNDGLPDTDIHAFGAAGDARLFGAGPNVGVITSIDGGVSWEQLTADAGQGFFGRIVVDSSDPDHLIAADAGAGPAESRDGGRSWRTLAESPALWVSSTESLATIVASRAGAAIRTTDGGATWEPLTLPGGASLVEIDPARPSRLYTGIHDGERVTVMVSDDAGATWQPP